MSYDNNISNTSNNLTADEIDKLITAKHDITWQAARDAFCLAREQRKEVISTGYKYIDRAIGGGLANELYIIGAQTSTGKSALTISMSERIARAGHDVLYFALEMGENEIRSRGVSATSHKHHLINPNEAEYTHGSIYMYMYDDQLDKFTILPNKAIQPYIDEYYEYIEPHFKIYENINRGYTSADICNISARWKEKYGVSPVVIVDYGQLTAPGDNKAEADRKTRVDVAIRNFAGLAKYKGMPVIFISSLSRAGYGQSVTLNALKESGDLEYTGGTILGWNWLGVMAETDSTNPENRIKEDSEYGYRCMRLDVLKGRGIPVGTQVEMTYYPAYNYFAEDGDIDFIEFSETLNKEQRKRLKNINFDKLFKKVV